MESVTVVVTGGGDDNVEVEVNGRIVEEFSTFDPDGVRLDFSDGTVVAATFVTESRDGGWRVTVVEEGTSITHRDRRPVTGLDRDYTDRVTLTGLLAWVTIRQQGSHDKQRINLIDR